MAALVSVMPVVVGGGCNSSSNSSIGKCDASGDCNSSSNSSSNGSIGKCDGSGGCNSSSNAALVSVMPVVVGGGCNGSSNGRIGKCDASGGWWWL